MTLTPEEIEDVALDGATLAYRYLPSRSDETAIDELTLQGAVVAKASELLVKDVIYVRKLGHSWAVIGDALGVSRQAAQQRYGRHCGES